MKNPIHALKTRILYSFVAKWLNGKKEVALVGPLFWVNGDDRKIILDVQKFRREQNAVRAPYLDAPAQLRIENELQIDERSAHFVAFKQNEVVACIRLTPGPFEMERLSPFLKERAQDFKDYYEFSRLCTQLTLKSKGSVACLMLLKSGLWLFSESKARGIVGICKQERVRYMSRFGLVERNSDLSIEGRGDGYAVISGSKFEIIFCFLKYFLGFEKKSTTVTAPLKIVTPWSQE